MEKKNNSQGKYGSTESPGQTGAASDLTNPTCGRPRTFWRWAHHGQLKSFHPECLWLKTFPGIKLQLDVNDTIGDRMRHPVLIGGWANKGISAALLVFNLHTRPEPPKMRAFRCPRLLCVRVCGCVCQSLQSCLTPCEPKDCSPPGSSVHGILQARILEWVAIPFSRGSSRPGGQTWVSCIAGGFFTSWATREAQTVCNTLQIPPTPPQLSTATARTLQWAVYTGFMS